MDTSYALKWMLMVMCGYTHISIFACLMRGDYDNDLRWPFDGDIVVELLNWREDNHHYRGDIIDLNQHNDTVG